MTNERETLIRLIAEMDIKAQALEWFATEAQVDGRDEEALISSVGADAVRECQAMVRRRLGAVDE